MVEFGRNNLCTSLFSTVDRMTKGFDTAAKRLKERAQILQGTRGTLYRPDLTDEMQQAIDRNSDSSYASSPAKDVAKRSANNWQHSTKIHILNILAPTFANYRQYQCGGVPLAVLVEVGGYGRQQMRERFFKVLHEAK
jgi:hypothetical protein